jgi:hypothetical protein
MSCSGKYILEAFTALVSARMTSRADSTNWRSGESDVGEEPDGTGCTVSLAMVC